MNNNTVITISRQYGSGGRELSEILAKKLGVKLYDRQIIHMAAALLGIGDLTEESLHELENKVLPLSSGFMPFYAFGSHAGPNVNTELFFAESKVIHQLVNDGPCVILGRCADYILSEEPNHYSFFIYADEDYRENRGRTSYGGKTLKQLNAEDKKRAEYYKYHTGRVWGEPKNYDCIINTSKMSLEEAADMIIAYVNIKQKNA